MKLATVFTALALMLAPALGSANQAEPTIAGDYLEVRTCDVYTGPCFANGEMGLAGKEAILVWSVTEGAWKGTELEGLKVLAVVRTDDTLGDQRYNPREGRAMLIVDEKADAEQRQALADMAVTLADGLIKEVVTTEVTAIEAQLGSCTKSGCAAVKAGEVEIATRCLNGSDHACGNETTFYPPLTNISEAMPAFTTLASFQDGALDLKWKAVDQRGTFIGKFSR